MEQICLQYFVDVYKEKVNYEVDYFILFSVCQE
jgi:hypothetical protein